MGKVDEVSWLTEPFQFPFMQYAYLIAVLIGVPCALLSCFLVLKGWSLMGDAVSHAVFPGVVLAHVAGIPLAVGAFLSGLSAALLTGWLKENSKIKEDTVMGIVFSGMFGFGLVLFTWVPTGLHLDHILFGNILGITEDDLLLSGVIGIAVTLGVLVKWRDLVLFSFDPAQAQTLGLTTRVLHYGLLIALSLTIVATLRAAGIVLAVGLLIAPGAIAFLVARQFATMMVVAVLVTLFAAWAGITISFWIDSAPAPTMILVLTALFVLAFVAKVFGPAARGSNSDEKA